MKPRVLALVAGILFFPACIVQYAPTGAPPRGGIRGRIEQKLFGTVPDRKGPPPEIPGVPSPIPACGASGYDCEHSHYVCKQGRFVAEIWSANDAEYRRDQPDPRFDERLCKGWPDGAIYPPHGRTP